MMILQHPNIAKLEEVRESVDEVFLILELCPGGTLYSYMNHLVLFL
jgi:serine/threonine protein kinase